MGVEAGWPGGLWSKDQAASRLTQRSGDLLTKTWRLPSHGLMQLKKI